MNEEVGLVYVFSTADSHKVIEWPSYELVLELAFVVL